jgi:hypothetical protein
MAIMPSITPNFDDVVELGPGEYPVRVVGSEIKTSQAGNDYINWTLEVFDAEDPRLNGEKTWHRTMVSGKGAGFLKDMFVAMTGELPPASFDTDDYHGSELVAVLVPRRDDPNRTEVKTVKAWRA